MQKVKWRFPLAFITPLLLGLLPFAPMALKSVPAAASYLPEEPLTLFPMIFFGLFLVLAIALLVHSGVLAGIVFLALAGLQGYMLYLEIQPSLPATDYVTLLLDNIWAVCDVVLLLGMAILCFSCFAENSASGIFLATFGLIPRLFILLELYEGALPENQKYYMMALQILWGLTTFLTALWINNPKKEEAAAAPAQTEAPKKSGASRNRYRVTGYEDDPAAAKKKTERSTPNVNMEELRKIISENASKYDPAMADMIDKHLAQMEHDIHGMYVAMAWCIVIAICAAIGYAIYKFA